MRGPTLESIATLCTCSYKSPSRLELKQLILGRNSQQLRCVCFCDVEVVRFVKPIIHKCFFCQYFDCFIYGYIGEQGLKSKDTKISWLVISIRLVKIFGKSKNVSNSGVINIMKKAFLNFSPSHLVSLDTKVSKKYLPSRYIYIQV